MKKFFILTLVCFTTLLYSPVRAQSFYNQPLEKGYYLGAQGGVNFFESSYLRQRLLKCDTGYTGGIVVGYSWFDSSRLESEVTYNHSRYGLKGTNLDLTKRKPKGNIYSWSAMLNTYFDILGFNICEMTPYLGGGIGSDYLHQSIKKVGKKDKVTHTDFAWQLMAGLNYFVLADVAFSAEYKYHQTEISKRHPLKSQSITFGIKKFFSIGAIKAVRTGRSHDIRRLQRFVR